MVARAAGGREVAGSNPVSPTKSSRPDDSLKLASELGRIFVLYPTSILAIRLSLLLCYYSVMDDNKNQNPIVQASEPQQLPQVTQPNQASSLGQTVQSSGSAGNNHKILKIYLVVTLVILILNAGLLSLTLIPPAGVYIALGAAPFFLASGVLGLVNLFVVSRALSKKYFTDGFRKVAITVLILSIMAVLGGVSSPFILAMQHKENAKTQKVQDKVNAYYSEVTVEKATELLNSCKIYSFKYSNPKGSDWEKTPETTSSGILIFDEFTHMGEPSSSAWANARGKYVMNIADRKVDTIVPIARQAQKTCDIKFRHDNTDEQRKDGHWYFKGILVN